MIKIIIGEKGAGKTRAFVDMVNVAANEEKGNVVCITRGNRLMVDLKPSVRMVDTSEFSITGYNTFASFIAGIVSGNFDITHIFIDSLTKIAGDDKVKLVNFTQSLEKLSQTFNIKFTLTISACADDMPEEIKKFFVTF